MPSIIIVTSISKSNINTFSHLDPCGAFGSRLSIDSTHIIEDTGIYHFNRDHDVKKGGGVALVFKNSFKFISGKTFACDSFEGIVVSIAGNTSRKLNFIVIYRFCEVAPTLFLSDFYKFIENIFINLKNLIILGDFNLHVNEKSDPNVIRFYDILSSFS